jgi:hypothetical protein
MKIVRESAHQQLAHTVQKLSIDRTACLFFIIGMVLAAMFMQALFY